MAAGPGSAAPRAAAADPRGGPRGGPRGRTALCRGHGPPRGAGGDGGELGRRPVELLPGFKLEVALLYGHRPNKSACPWIFVGDSLSITILPSACLDNHETMCRLASAEDSVLMVEPKGFCSNEETMQAGPEDIHTTCT